MIPHPSAHAVLRFVERGGATCAVRAEADLVALAAKARPVKVVPPRFRDTAKKGARFLVAGEWVLVVRGETTVTVYPREGQWRWAG